MLLDIIFGVLMLVIFGRLLIFGIKATWSIFKFLFFIVFAPLILIVLAFAGFIYVALVLLIVFGVISLIKTLV